ncbi:MAG: hypothetical protein A3B25_03890 [Candidatus Ryanbacteria bacterium RIFCSPLOWO2_01_FULL_48_26]|uniref:Ribonuclease n=1 Tax=Candidatus Ryanbacteria bacterium RIFCSPLOWO2_01_FULL_48_26 TaxID=1802126 RepID=A0A1G2GT37_9BACT|nr:MAG: hypothetical protein A3B25_03890 [Candidatus Ryanbacteria bacterium RIFCSPLOWO2_01_FULL_48_26]
MDEVGRAARKRASLARSRFVIGLDEVGRGSLAGAVVVCAVCIPKNLKLVTNNSQLGKLRDSKKLTRAKREAWYEYLRFHSRVRYAFARVHPATIDRINISRAANLAALRAFRRLCGQCALFGKCRVFLDGGLYLGNKKMSVEDYGAQTIVRGDERITAVKIASIIAKVTRDRSMKKLSRKFPDFGFEIHNGYGTERHIAAVKKFGPSQLHRLTFLKKYLKIRELVVRK